MWCRPAIRVLCVVASVVLCALPSVVAGQPLHLALQRTVLPNGVTVIVWERPSSGRIGTRVFYRVDVAAERPGTSGLTHMLEHYLFKGSDIAGASNWAEEAEEAATIERLSREITDVENRDRNCLRQRDVFAEVERAAACVGPELAALQQQLDAAIARQNALSDPTWYDWLVQSAGGTNSTASTGRDWMKFDIDLPANKLELFMWTERSRVEHPVFRQFEAEREVVVDQIRRYDNRPDGRFDRALTSMTYDAHPYGWAHWFSDLTRATREDHWEIFHRYFIPQNTILVVVGEVEAARVFEMARAYWGDWQPGRPSPRLRTVEPPPVGQKRLLVTAPAGPAVAVHARMPAVGHADAPVFEVLAEVLGGRQGLLTRTLVDERRVATSTRASATAAKYPSHLALRVEATSNETLAEVETGLAQVLDSLAEGRVQAADVRAAAERLVLRMASGLEEVGPSAVAIGAMEAIHHADHLNALPDLWRSVSVDDVARVARTYLREDMRVVGVLRRGDAPVVPATTPPASSEATRPTTMSGGVPPRAPASTPRAASGATGEVPPDSPLAVAEAPWYAPPWMATRRPSAFASAAPTRRPADLRFTPRTFTPPDADTALVAREGLPPVYHVEDRLLPMVQATVFVDTPSTVEPTGREGIAVLTAGLVERGWTVARSRADVRATLDRLGATVRVDTDRTGARVHLLAPAAGAAEALALLADMVSQPRLDAEYDAERDRQALRADRQADAAAEQMQALFDRTLYGERHPMARRATAASVRAITRDDVRQFHATHYSPLRMAIAVSGAISRAEVLQALTQGLSFSPPPAGGVPPQVAPVPARTARTVVTTEIDSRQGHVYMGHLGIEGTPRDHAALEVMHHVLAGGGFFSRMMRVLRTDTGITAALYGQVAPGRGVANPYLWRFSGRPETLAEGVRLALREIETMRERGVTPAEFEAARTAYLDGLIPASYETAHRTAERFALKRLVGLYAYQSPQYLNYYAGDAEQVAAIRALTLEDVNQAARTYLQPDRMVIVVGGPLDRIPPVESGR